MALSEQLTRLRARLPAGPSLRLSPAFEERFMGCLPQPVRRVLADLNRRLVIQVDGDKALLSLMAGTELKWEGRVDATGNAVLPESELGRGKDRRYTTELLPPPSAVLVRSVSFPAQVRANLGQVLRYELDRLSPFAVDDVYYEYRIRPSAKTADRITVDLAICRRDTVGDWIRRLADAGHPVDRVIWAGAWRGANLLPLEARPRRAQTWLSPKTGVVFLTLALLAAVMVTPLYQKWQYVRYLVAEVRKAQTQAITVDDIRQQLEHAKEGSMAVIQRKLEQPLLMDLLRELTARLPDDTWLQGLEYDQGEVQLRGESSQATALIALLEQAPGIDGVSFKSPVVQVARTGKERFNIGFRYVRQGNP